MLHTVDFFTHLPSFENNYCYWWTDSRNFILLDMPSR